MSAWPIGPVCEIETERLRLRRFREDDLDAYARITADPEVMRHVGGRPLSRDEAWCSLRHHEDHWERRGFGLFAAEEKASGALVGRIGLYRPEGWPGLEVGWLVDRARQGEGFATEGGSAALRFAFETVAPARVISVIEPGNAVSIRVATKLGERFLHDTELHGKRVRIYGIDHADWEAA